MVKKVTGFGKRIIEGHWISRIYATIAIVTVLVVLYGWLTNNEGLKRIRPDFTSMNPITGTCLMLVAICIWLSTFRTSPSKRWIIRILLTFIAVTGFFVLLRYFKIVDVPVDRWMFNDRLDSPGYPPSKMAPNVALNFVLIAAIFALGRYNSRKARIAAQVLLCFAAFLVLTAIFGYVYGLKGLYQVGKFIPMALHTGLMLLLLLMAVLGLHNEWYMSRRLRRVGLVAWLSFAVFVLAITLTGISWRSSVSRLDSEANNAYNIEYAEVSSLLDQRLNTYVDALYSTRSLFAASSDVTRQDFHNYLTSLDLQKKYPGFRAVYFARRVPAAEKAAFVLAARQDTSYKASDVSNFKISPERQADVYYPVMYVEPNTPTSVYGFDINSTPERAATVAKTIQTGVPAASDTVNLNQARPERPEALGFFISLVTYKNNGKAPTADNVLGTVNAAFEYEVLFSGLLKGIDKEGVTVRIYDDANDKVIFEQLGAQGIADDYRTSAQTIQAANRLWRVEVKAPKYLDVSQNERDQPRLILVSGIVISILILLVFVSLARSRQRAVALADKMTLDLRTERNQAVALQQKDEAILSSIGDAVFAIDTDERIVLFNPAAQEVSGFTEKEALGKPYGEVLQFRSEGTDKVNNAFVKKALGGTLTSMANHTYLVRKNGKHVPVADSAAPIRDSHGKVQGAIIVFRDVTKEHELDKAKDEFVSLTSHQLRTPLTAIRLFSEMLSNQQVGKLTNEQKDYIDKIEVSTERMIRLVGDILNVSRIELGRLKIEPSATDLQELVQSHVDEVRPLAESKNVTIRVDIDSDVAEQKVDPSLYGQAVHNLLTNAIRYTDSDKGEVTVRLYKKGASTVFAVSDNGIGIPHEAQKHIFTKFYRADNAVAVEGEGTGLGLYLIKMIMEQSGGGVSFESETGKGTTFYVTIPQEGMKPKKGDKSLGQ